MVLQWFWACFERLSGAKTMTKRQREDLWKCLFYLCILLFSWFVGFIWGAKMRDKQSGIPIWIKTLFYCDFGFVLKVILASTNDEKSIEISMDFGGIPGGVPG